MRKSPHGHSDSNNGRVIGSLPIGPGPDDSAYDPQTRLVYTSNGGDGTVSIIQQDSPDDYRVFETVKTAPGARNMALDLKTKKIFLPLSDRESPSPTPQNPNPRGNVIPGTFRVLVFGM
jgi:DNA-binding beta-propeller fold protein YncE